MFCGSPGLSGRRCISISRVTYTWNPTVCRGSTLSRPIPQWGTSLDQGRPTKLDAYTKAREGSICKAKGGQQDYQDGLQGLHYVRSYPRTEIFFICAQRNRGYSHGIWNNCKRNQWFPVGSKLYVAINGQFDYGGGYKDAHDWYRFWVNDL